MKAGSIMVRKIMIAVSVVFGLLTFLAVAFAEREGSSFDIGYTCIPALLCIMSAIAAANSEEQKLDMDEAETDAAVF